MDNVKNLNEKLESFLREIKKKDRKNEEAGLNYGEKGFSIKGSNKNVKNLLDELTQKYGDLTIPKFINKLIQAEQKGEKLIESYGDPDIFKIWKRVEQRLNKNIKLNLNKPDYAYSDGSFEFLDCLNERDNKRRVYFDELKIFSSPGPNGLEEWKACLLFVNSQNSKIPQDWLDQINQFASNYLLDKKEVVSRTTYNTSYNLSLTLYKSIVKTNQDKDSFIENTVKTIIDLCNKYNEQFITQNNNMQKENACF